MNIIVDRRIDRHKHLYSNFSNKHRLLARYFRSLSFCLLSHSFTLFEINILIRQKDWNPVFIRTKVIWAMLRNAHGWFDSCFFCPLSSSFFLIWNLCLKKVRKEGWNPLFIGKEKQRDCYKTAKKINIVKVNIRNNMSFGSQERI